VYCFV